MKKAVDYLFPLAVLLVIGLSFTLDFRPGMVVSSNLLELLIEMITFIPFLFIIIGLFDIWFPKETVQRHIGEESGFLSIVLVIILGMFQAGPLYGAFPVAALLYRKGASIRNIFIYLGAFSTLKIPMLGIEIGYLGPKFTLVRTLVSLPLFIGIGYIMGWYLKNRDFRITEP